MPKILVVVPERDQRELYIFALRFAGHQCFGASQLVEAVTLAREVQPDLVLLDVRLLGNLQENRLPTTQEIINLKIPLLYLVDQQTKPESLPSLKPGSVEFIIRSPSLDLVTKKVNRLSKIAGVRK